MSEKRNVLDKAIASLAFKESKAIANSSCVWFFHQPKTPDKVKKLRKF